MKFLSVCSGIEAASVAFGPLGWEAVGFSELEKFPCELLRMKYPGVRNFGDLTKWRDWDVNPFNVLCGGTPCQGFSVAGKRGGMDDPRSQLAWDFIGLAEKYRPGWILWENVPGVFSSWSDEEGNDAGGSDRQRGIGDRWWETNDFVGFTSALEKLGYGVAWAVLDAQYFDLAQQRERVFVVGYLGDWRPAAAVLLDAESLSGNPAPRREKETMTPVDQTKFGEATGNCFAACLASVLDIPLEDVPELNCAEQWETALAWLWSKGMTAVEINFRPRAKPPYLFKHFGLKGTGVVIAGGKSPRGDFDHAVVLSVDQNKQEVKFIHDPHPSRKFIEDIEGLMFIMPKRLKHV